VIFLHVGAMKTGTTFLQHLMDANRENLNAAGILVAGDRRERSLGTSDILGTAHKRPEQVAAAEGMWDDLVSRMFAHQGAASVLSHEFLSFAGPKQAARVVGSLEGAEVHVILTVRNATNALPSQWQTHVRSGGNISWPRFAKSVRRGLRGQGPARGRGARTYLRTQGIPRMLDVWGSALPPERLHVVTVPPSGSDPWLLWQRFAGVIGVDPAACTISTPRSKPSLGHPSADLMRRINEHLGRLPQHQYAPTLKIGLGMQILGERAHLESSAKLDVGTRRFAANWNQRVRTAIEHSGAHVVGDLSDLPVKPSGTAAAKRLSDPAADDLLAAAETARDGLVRLVKRRRRQLSKGGEADDQAGDADVDLAHLPTTRERWGDAPDPVDAAVTELSALALVAIDLHRRLAPPEEHAHHSPAAAAEHD